MKNTITQLELIELLAQATSFFDQEEYDFEEQSEQVINLITSSFRCKRKHNADFHLDEWSLEGEIIGSSATRSPRGWVNWPGLLKALAMMADTVEL